MSARSASLQASVLSSVSETALKQKYLTSGLETKNSNWRVYGQHILCSFLVT